MNDWLDDAPRLRRTHRSLVHLGLAIGDDDESSRVEIVASDVSGRNLRLRFVDRDDVREEPNA